MTHATKGRGLDIHEVNVLKQADFVALFGSTFENSPWVAESAWAARPFASFDALHGALIGVVRRSPRATQIAFLCSHPELAGKEAEAGTMTTESVGEQSSAGLHAMSRDEIDELHRLNTRYLNRHGFPFIIAVRRYSKIEIFEQLRYRIERDSVTELTEAMLQISSITRLRVQDKVATDTHASAPAGQASAPSSQTSVSGINTTSQNS
jgi:2-oxo-4-hydroxy-4-carboxy-5-ureidoimidazoline decarboxylase